MYRHKWKRAWIGGVCGALLRTLIHDNSRHHQTICRNFVFCLFHLKFLRKWLFFPHLHNVDLRANDGSRWRVTLEGGHSLPRWSWSEGIWVSHNGAGGECAVVCKGNVQEKCSDLPQAFLEYHSLHSQFFIPWLFNFLWKVLKFTVFMA